MKNFKNQKNFASKDSGATILSSGRGIKNPKAILSGNKDEYLIMPNCSGGVSQDLIINLSEDAVIDAIIVTNFEDFSDKLLEIELTGGIDLTLD